MWSPSFVPKPRDWGPLYDVVGYFLEEKDGDDGKTDESSEASSHQDGSADITCGITSRAVEMSPLLPQPIRDFLAAGPPPIFVGFGSMVIADASSLVDTILQVGCGT